MIRRSWAGDTLPASPSEPNFLAGPPWLAGIASAGSHPSAWPLPAVLPVDHPEAAWRVSLRHRRRLAGPFELLLWNCLALHRRTPAMRSHGFRAMARRRKASRMSHDTTRSDRRRPILHLRHPIGSTSVSRTNSTCLSIAAQVMKQGTGDDRPDAAQRKHQGERCEE